MNEMNKITNRYSTFLKYKGVDPTTLTTELRKKSVQMMSLKERSEHINNMRLPFGVVRCTPNLLLNKWLGMNIDSVIQIGNCFFKETESSDFIIDTQFTISVVTKSEVYDFGFLLKTDEELTNEVLVIGEDEDPFVPFSFVEHKIRNGLSLPKPTLQ